MRKTPTYSVGSDDVLQVENKWPYLPITPTCDQYVQQWVTLFKFRVDVWFRVHNFPEDRVKRPGLGDVRCPCVSYTDYV